MINEQEIVDVIDLIDYTLSDRFTKKWEHKFSIVFIDIFKLRLLKALSENKPIKLKTLYNIYIKHKYSREQILNFFNSIEIELYDPLIFGNLSSL